MTLPSQVQTFLSQNNLATLAAIDSGSDYPHVLPIFYALDEQFVLYFPSKKESKKLQNILAHPHIGMSITDSKNLLSLELRCAASLVASAEKKVEILQKLSKSSVAGSEDSFPPVMKVPGESGIQIIACHIDWFRLSSYGEQKAVFIEGSQSD